MFDVALFGAACSGADRGRPCCPAGSGLVVGGNVETNWRFTAAESLDGDASSFGDRSACGSDRSTWIASVANESATNLRFTAASSDVEAAGWDADLGCGLTPSGPSVGCGVDGSADAEFTPGRSRASVSVTGTTGRVSCSGCELDATRLLVVMVGVGGSGRASSSVRSRAWPVPCCASTLRCDDSKGCFRSGTRLPLDRSITMNSPFVSSTTWYRLGSRSCVASRSGRTVCWVSASRSTTNYRLRGRWRCQR